VLSLLFRNLIFTILQPGIVAGLVPYWILKSKTPVSNDQSLKLYQFAGEIVFTTGLIIMLYCIINFATRGKGTLSPIDPTKKLVITGLYKFSRNPMYIGVMIMLIGEAIFFRSADLWIYSAAIFAAFNLFIMFFEEPRLRKDFEKEYEQYCKKTRRWI
jgi:protein-S-isoprenylcysteine O-methyltransferase Ste14